MNSQGRLISRFTQQLAPGVLRWIGVRRARKEEMDEFHQVQALVGFGLQGDHRCQGSEGSARQVTLISAEYLQLIASYLNIGVIEPQRLRRNLVVSGINLNALRHQRFRIGEAEFEATAHCHPCSRMEKELGSGGVAAMLGHGGICAKITRSGLIRVGDQLLKVD
ncbi:MAG: MOSC domain-containing protein [Motiliproteus sp.]